MSGKLGWDSQLPHILTEIFWVPLGPCISTNKISKIQRWTARDKKVVAISNFSKKLLTTTVLWTLQRVKVSYTGEPKTPYQYYNETNLKLQISIQIEKKAKYLSNWEAKKFLWNLRKSFFWPQLSPKKNWAQLSQSGPKLKSLPKNVNKKRPNFLKLCNFGSDWDNWTQFFWVKGVVKINFFLAFIKISTALSCWDI